MMPSNSRSHSLTIMGDLSTTSMFGSVPQSCPRSVADPVKTRFGIIHIHPVRESLTALVGDHLNIVRDNPTTVFFDYRFGYFTAQDPNESMVAGDNSMAPGANWNNSFKPCSALRACYVQSDAAGSPAMDRTGHRSGTGAPATYARRYGSTTRRCGRRGANAMTRGGGACR